MINVIKKLKKIADDGGDKGMSDSMQICLEIYERRERGEPITEEESAMLEFSELFLNENSIKEIEKHQKNNKDLSIKK